MTRIKIHNVSRTLSRPTRPSFSVGTEALTFLVAVKEVRHVFTELGRRVRPFKLGQKRFWNADSPFDSLGKIDLPLATPRGIPTFFVKVDFVAADVPALLSLDICDEYALFADTVTNKLIKRDVLHVKDG